MSNNSDSDKRNGKPRPTRKPKSAHSVEGGSTQANRLAIAILEVLAGQRSPADAASALGVSLPRYYQLETRALNGLVAACEPRPKGKQPSLKTRIKALESELAVAQREVARHQALVRAAHRSLGLKAAPTSTAPANGAKGKGKSKAKGQAGKSRRRTRRPTVRALKAVQALEEKARSSAAAEVQPKAQDGSVETVVPQARTGASQG